jgi:enoyl-CoA hydratase/carnithine racemase
VDFQDIRVERADRWLEIRIERPEKLNAIRNQTAIEILSVLEEADLDKEIAGVILSGYDKAFCTGIDTSEFSVDPGEFFDFYRYRRRSRPIGRLFRELPSFSKPIIVAVEGFALGGGMELMMLCDIAIAGEKARFGLPEGKLGMLPGGGGTQTLPRLIGKALAKELIWTGRRITAEEALAMRIVTHKTPAGEALDRARELMREIAANAPLPVMLAKSLIDRGFEQPLDDALAAEADTSFMLYFSTDRNEGITAFREKRTAEFKGR